jgi:adenosine deaminase CECR1
LFEKVLKLTNMCVGFDLVCEEDKYPTTDEYVELIIEARARIGADKMNLFLHAGESDMRSNTALFDAVLLGCKRIGHGFALINHPVLLDMVKENNICLEVCPVSNDLLGYQHDMRTHPVRHLLTKGVKCSINPDDNGFFNSPGVTLDFVEAYMSWDLDLSDLKSLAINSLEFASISQQEKDDLFVFFEGRWRRFLTYVRSRF